MSCTVQLNLNCRPFYPGYLGVRVFNPQPVSKVIETVGGCDVLLAIVAMSRDMEALYAGVKALVCVLKSNPFAR